MGIEKEWKVFMCVYVCVCASVCVCIYSPIDINKADIIEHTKILISHSIDIYTPIQYTFFFPTFILFLFLLSLLKHAISFIYYVPDSYYR